ncbi:MAG: hypothetical protein NTW75_13585 [Planctomycetales bacterium]|nr:hypothetical protein [Planctomycetales bacterium]
MFPPIRPRFLFVCLENSKRSQMAEAFARIYGVGRLDALNTGSRPSGSVNPKAIEAMKHRHYDLTAHKSKSIDELPAGDYTVVVTMGCGDVCPQVKATHHEDW